jgi:hypothetical protein
MVPEYWTTPAGERSKWLSMRIHRRGPITSESTTLFGFTGTVLSIFSKIVKQVSSKDCVDAAMALIVEFIGVSEVKMRRSDWNVGSLVVTSGPPP